MISPETLYSESHFKLWHYARHVHAQAYKDGSKMRLQHIARGKSPRGSVALVQLATPSEEKIRLYLEWQKIGSKLDCLVTLQKRHDNTIQMNNKLKKTLS